MGIPWRSALHDVPAALINDFLACHWLAKGVEIEAAFRPDEADDVRNQFEQLAAKSWDL